MRFKTIRLQHFKCFSDSGEIPLAPLTVIFGKNNSGKSSLIHSLLLLKQSTQPQDIVPRLNLRGPSYSAGSYSDVVHQHLASQHMTIGVGVQSEAASGSIELEFASEEPQAPRLNRIKITPTDGVSVEVRRGRGHGGPYELWIDGAKAGRQDDRVGFSFTNGILPFISGSPFGSPPTPKMMAKQKARRVLHVTESLLNNIRSVGAFRAQPARRYEYEGAQAGIEDRGQRVVDALYSDSISRRNRGSLLKSVNRWLKSVGRVRLMPIRRISTSARLYELRVRDTDSGRWANFADVGFGIGQALPVIVEGLETPVDGTYIVQEPEIHLHPDAQLGMADFLISLVKSGRQVIVETHSEPILLRLRRAVVARPNGRVSSLPIEDLGVLFVTKKGNGASDVTPLDIDKMGNIENWPRGFLEDVSKERMALLRDMAAKM